MVGTVYKSTGSWYTVKTNEEVFYDCRIKGKFRIKGIKSTVPIAVGDKVEFRVEKIGGETNAIIINIKDRKNYIVRKSVNLSKQTHIIASNLDQVFLIITLNNPQTFTSFIDRFLVTAEAYSITAVLLFNKIDSYSKDEQLEIKHLASLYKNIGYKCIVISAKKGNNVDKVRELMVGKTSMFSGHSGVGKSTLINTMDNNLDIKTKEISQHHMQGQHTTAFAEMYDLDFDTQIIDTPGIKGFGIVDIEKEEIGDYFPDFLALKNDCKFNDCLHLNEPQCAVKNALDKDKIAWSRYKSYVQMVTDKDENYRVDIYADGK